MDSTKLLRDHHWIELKMLVFVFGVLLPTALATGKPEEDKEDSWSQQVTLVAHSTFKADKMV